MRINFYLKSAAILLTGAAFSGASYSDTLGEIASFSERICNDVEVEGEITRSRIEGKLQGSSGLLPKLVGADVEGGASLSLERDVFNNLPLNELSDQFSDARACKKDLATLLVMERSKYKKKSKMV